MSRPKAHYSMIIKNNTTGDRWKVELVDLPFADGRRFRVRVNGQWARKVPVAKQNDRHETGARMVGQALEGRCLSCGNGNIF